MNIQSNKSTTPLRQRMIEDMAGRNLGRHSRHSHLSSCERFAAFLERSPETAMASEDQCFRCSSDMCAPARLWASGDGPWFFRWSGL